MVEFKENQESIEIMEDNEFTKRIENTFSDSVKEALVASKAILAGGAMTSYFSSSEISDFDLYFESKEMLDKFIFTLPSNFDAQYFITDKSMTIKSQGIILQLIYYKFHPKDRELVDWYQVSSCESIFKSFDFTINMCAYSFHSKIIVHHRDFFKHLGQRKLMFWKGTDYPLVSALRLDKYSFRGYSAPLSEKLKVYSEISKIDLSSSEKLIEHIGSMYGLKVKKLKEQLEKKLGEGWEFNPTEAIDLVVDSCKLESSYNLLPNSRDNTTVKWTNFSDFRTKIDSAKKKNLTYTVLKRYDNKSNEEDLEYSCVYFEMVAGDMEGSTKVDFGKSWSIKHHHFWKEFRLFLPQNEVSMDYLEMVDPDCKKTLYKEKPVFDPKYLLKDNESNF
jgi:hypothetical protein